MEHRTGHEKPSIFPDKPTVVKSSLHVGECYEFKGPAQLDDSVFTPWISTRAFPSDCDLNSLEDLKGHHPSYHLGFFLVHNL